MSAVDNGLILRPRVDLALNNIGILGLRAAINEGWTIFDMAGGFMDEFQDATGIDAVASVGATYDAGTDSYLIDGVTAVPGATGTPIGDMIEGGGLASAFDGVTNQSHNDGAAKNAGSQPGFIGKDWGAGTPKTIKRAVVWSSNNFGFWGGGDTTISFRLLGNSANNTGTATELGTASIADGNTISATINASVLSAFQYHWVEITVPSLGVYCAECIFYEGGPGALVSESHDPLFVPVASRAVILADPAPGAVLNTDLIAEFSRDGGTAWAAGTLAKLGDYSASVEIWEAQEADISGQPSGQALRVRLRSPTGTGGTVHAWYVQAR